MNEEKNEVPKAAEPATREAPKAEEAVTKAVEAPQQGAPSAPAKAEEAKTSAPAAAAAEAPKTAAAAPVAAPKAEAKEAPKKEKPSNCGGCNKSIKKKRWYYRDGKYYCTKRCWNTAMKKNEKKETAPAA